jgi:hypothetical protein
MLDSVEVNASESNMRKNPAKARPQNAIRAIFEDGMSTFLLPNDATLEELAGRLARLAKQHQGRPIAFKVKLGSLSG